MKVIETQTIADAHQKLVEYVYWNGIRMVTEDGQVCIEAEPVTVTIHKPIGLDNEMIHKNSPSGIKKCIEYVNQIFEGAEGFEYTYHERLFRYCRENGLLSIVSCIYNDIKELSYDEIKGIHGNELAKLKCIMLDAETAENLCFDLEEPINQIESIIDHLNEERMTRRAVAITWYPWKDPVTQHVPCLQFLQFKVRKQKLGFLHWLLGHKPKLDMYLLMRSNDVLGAAGSNMVGFAALLQFVANKTDCDIGKMEYIATIPHMYPKVNAVELKRMVKC
jgi:thymidylate synthase